jgi:hypothetical protein
MHVDAGNNIPSMNVLNQVLDLLLITSSLGRFIWDFNTLRRCELVGTLPGNTPPRNKVLTTNAVMNAFKTGNLDNTKTCN